MMKVGIYGVPAHPAGVSGILASVAVRDNAPARSAERVTDAIAIMLDCKLQHCYNITADGKMSDCQR